MHMGGCDYVCDVETGECFCGLSYNVFLYTMPHVFIASIAAVFFGSIIFFVFKEGKWHTLGKRMMLWGAIIALVIYSISSLMNMLGALA